MSIFFKALLIALALVGPLTWLVVVKFAPRDWTQRKSDVLSVRLWLYAPIWVSLLVVVSAMAPAVLTGFVLGVEHCVSHTNHHHHLCIWHATGHSHRSSAMLIPLFVALPSLLLVAATGKRILRERRLVGALLSTSRPSLFDEKVRLLDQEQPIALTVGWTRPTILLSTGLVDGLSASSLEAVIAHERAHVRRGDTMLAAVDRFAASILPDQVSLPLLQHLHLQRELACDSEAAKEARPLLVARALTDVARLRGAHTHCGASTVEPRVQRLLATDAEKAGPRLLPTLFVIASLATIGAWPVHNVIEHLLNFLLH